MNPRPNRLIWCALSALIVSGFLSACSARPAADAPTAPPTTAIPAVASPELPTQTSAQPAAPTDAPAATPTDVPSPAPTDRPVAEATTLPIATPTPEPTVEATATPIPTRSAADEGVAAVIGSFDNGGIVCDTDFGSRFDPTLGFSDFGQIGRLDAPCVFELSFVNYPPGTSISVAVFDPNGGALAAGEVRAGDDGAATWVFSVLLDTPFGDYPIEVRSGDGTTLQAFVSVEQPVFPRALVLPTSGGSEGARFYGSGLPAGDLYPVYLYRWRDTTGVAADFVRRLGDLRVDAVGAGALSFQLEADDTPGIYAVGYYTPARDERNFENCTDPDPAETAVQGLMFCFETFTYQP